MMLKTVFATLFLAAAALCSPAANFTASQALAQQATVELTDDVIDRLLVSLEEMRTLGKEYDSMRGANSVQGMVMALRGKAQANEIALRNGFADFAAWMDAMVTLGITSAFVASGKSLEEMRQQQDEALAKIEALPMDETQKDAMRKAIGQGFGVLGRITPENYALVQSRQDEIKQVMEN